MTKARGEFLAVFLGAVAGAAWFLVWFADAAYANDCLEYVKNASNIVKIPRGVLEDCFRTGMVQAGVTGGVGLIGGGTIAWKIHKTLDGIMLEPVDAPPDEQEPEAQPDDRPDDQPDDKPEPDDHSRVAMCPHCHEQYWYDPADPPGGMCPKCQRSLDEPPEDEPPVDHSRTTFEHDTCISCGAPLPNDLTPGARCPRCKAVNGTTTVGPCPHCGTQINLDSGDCPTCHGTFRPPEHDVPRDTDVNEGPPKDPRTVFETDTCSECHRPLPETMPPGGKCPFCRAKNPTTTVGHCPRCGNVINLDDGKCSCGAVFHPPKHDLPPEAIDDPKKVFANSACRVCHRPLPDAAGDGLCPACGANNETDFVGRCPTCRQLLYGRDAECYYCHTRLRPMTGIDTVDTAASDPSAQMAPGGGTSGGGTPGGSAPAGPPASAPSGPAAPATPPPPTVYNQQEVIDGPQAIHLLEKSGLAHITRDPSGKVVKIEEAFPHAFDNLGGSEVDINKGTGTIGGTDWARIAKGKIAGIGIDPATGEAVVVVNRGDAQWQQLPPDPAKVLQQAIEDATKKAESLAHDAKQFVQDQNAKVQSAMSGADAARSLYRGLQGVNQGLADKALQDFCKATGVNPLVAKGIFELDDSTFESIKSTIDMPNKIFGGSN